MDDALIGSADAEAPAERLHARDVFLDPADGDGRQSRSTRADLQDDQCRDAAHVFLGLSALGYRSALDDLRPALLVRAGQAQHPWRQREARLQSRAGAVGSEDQAPRRAPIVTKAETNKRELVKWPKDIGSPSTARSKTRTRWRATRSSPGRRSRSMAASSWCAACRRKSTRPGCSSARSSSNFRASTPPSRHMTAPNTRRRSRRFTARPSATCASSRGHERARLGAIPQRSPWWRRLPSPRPCTRKPTAPAAP